jgi:hypothetical protein
MTIHYVTLNPDVALPGAISSLNRDSIDSDVAGPGATSNDDSIDVDVAGPNPLNDDSMHVDVPAGYS